MRSKKGEIQSLKRRKKMLGVKPKVVSTKIVPTKTKKK